VGASGHLPRGGLAVSAPHPFSRKQMALLLAGIDIVLGR
jgi:hypothetical protein